MNRPRSLLRRIVLVLVGVLAGVYLQHRWPIGTWRHRNAVTPSPTQVEPATLANLAPSRRLVLLVLGQSNAANYGSERRSAGAGVYVFADEKLYPGRDPLPGADGFGGSIWSRLGARLMATGSYDAVVFAIVARGSRRVSDFLDAGTEARRLLTTLDHLARHNLPPAAVLWLQGETESYDAHAEGRAYQAQLNQVVQVCHRVFPAARFVVAQTTRHADQPINEAIRLAQAEVARQPGCAPGPDLDRLDAPFRADGTHFNDRGLSAAADLWMPAIEAALSSSSPPIDRP